ncbi:Ribonuclease 3 [Grifola frondosa]|uniref:Ribonuclease 3 n=1 Tax=Grifola frondosa TaxID=5627 RepID=A0A1C7MR56_GRIFR|nr:Ribonuclease 3 [Grifola frondosa]
MDTSALPRIPQLSGDIILEVFTHKSLRFPGAPTNEDTDYGDSDRLSVIGETMLDGAVKIALFKMRPMLKAHEMKPSAQSKRDDILSADNVASWVNGYKLKEKVRCGSQEAFNSLSDPEELRQLFYVYVGAVYVQSGSQALQAWIGQLVDPTAMPDEEPHKRFRADPVGFASSPPAYIHPMSSVAPPPPSTLPPPLPNPLAPAQPLSAFLPLFNQTANQRRLTVEYPAQFSGPAHAGRWDVQCIVDGILKGRGIGTSKQLAKEEAAREAYYAMGWAPRKQQSPRVEPVI